MGLSDVPGAAVLGQTFSLPPLRNLNKIARQKSVLFLPNIYGPKYPATPEAIMLAIHLHIRVPAK